jgi:glycerophosphoryl diester phosphodiesterase
MIKIESLIIPEPWPKGSLRMPRLQAHRGYWLDGDQENTLAAIRKAKTKGALMFECDVQLSKDRVPVLFHDQTLQKFSGNKAKVDELTVTELKELAKVSTLEEVLKDPDVPVLANIELKTLNHLNEALERKVAEVVTRLRLEHRVMFSSFNPTSLWRMKQYLPQVPRAFLLSANPSDNPKFFHMINFAPFLSVHLLHLHHGLCTESRLRRLTKNKIPFAVWTVNERDRIDYFLRQGAISVISDSLDF